MFLLGNLSLQLLWYLVRATVKSIDDENELKVNYYEKLIKDAIIQAQEYVLPTDNSAHFKNVSRDIKDFGTFDFIVVGAGSSGSVVASRLSEVEAFDILLLEAGGWDDDLTDIPYVTDILQSSERNWGYSTIPQRNGCYGWKERRCSYPRGKLVGGSGSINGLVYVRGNKADYDNWASMGNPGWSFEEVLPYFKKLENYKSDDIDLNYRGFSGPVNTVFGNLKYYFDILSDALSEICMKIIGDYNAENQIGSSRNQKNTESARRVSGATAYVRPSMTRHNFNVTVRALVTKILINQFTRTAYGVEFIKNGQRYKAMATREVILSAGAINTPQLLMLSGIGPADELLRFDIPIIANLPVGKQLKDHYVLLLSYKNNSTINYISFREAIQNYLNGVGILGRPRNAIGFSFVNTRNASFTVPNVEFTYNAPSPLCQQLPSNFNLTDQVLEYAQQVRSTFDINIILLHPKSSGTLKLKSNSIIDYPLIDIEIFENEEDMEVFYESIKLIIKIGETKLAKKYSAQLVKFQFCEQYNYNSKEYWFCFLKYLATTSLHASTTAKMAPLADPFAVVDYELHVYGIKKLRVADCSIMPTPISGHNNAAAFMIGEKAATLVKSANSV